MVTFSALQLWSITLANLRKQRKYSGEVLGKRDSSELVVLPHVVVKEVFRISQNMNTCGFVCG